MLKASELEGLLCSIDSLSTPFWEFREEQVRDIPVQEADDFLLPFGSFLVRKPLEANL